MTVVVSAAILALATAGTIVGWSTSEHLTAMLALLAAGLAAFAAPFWSSPLRAPFRTLGVVVILLLAAAAVMLTVVSTWHTPRLLTREWPILVYALSIAQLAPFRPARDLVSATILGTVGVSFLAILAPTESLSLPPFVVIVETVLPILGLGLGAAEFARALANRNRPWYSSSSIEPACPIRRSRAWCGPCARTGSPSSTTLLSRSSPSLLQRDEVTDDDRSRARAIGDSIRAAMVADVDRSWLDSVLDDLAGRRGDGSIPGSEAMQDPDRLAVGMSTEQRIVVRALVIALLDHPGFDPDGFGILISRDGATAGVTLTAKLDADESLARTGLLPYLGVVADRIW